jgi:uncharacterized protein involved in outer membrane biogenesis
LEVPAIRRPLTIILGLVIIVAAFAGGVIAVVLTVDFAPFIARHASAALDRRVSIGQLQIDWRNPLILEVQEVRLASPDWGSKPDMIRVGHLKATINLGALFQGVMRFENLRVEDLAVLLERDAQHVGNWRFKGAGTKPASRGGLAVVPANRTQFPTLIDFALRRGEVIYRTSSGGTLTIRFDDAQISAPDDDAPAKLVIDGAYNGTKLRLIADTESFARMRDDSAPFGAKISIASPSGTLDLDGTLVEPVDFEGVHGALRIAAPKLGAFLKIFGADLPADFALKLAGTLDKQGDNWQVAQATGDVAGNAFRGTVALAEGGRGQPDRIALDLAFPRLDLVQITPRDSPSRDPGAKPTNWRETDFLALRPDEKPGATLEARVTAKELIRGATRLPDFAVQGRLNPGEIVVRKLGFAFAGGRIESTARVKAIPGGSRIEATANMLGADAEQVLQLLGIEGMLAGPIDGSVTLELAGPTMQAALPSSRGQAVLSMANGRVAVEIIEKAALDLRALFRKREGWSELSCVLGVVDLRNGVATISPLRLRTSNTTLLAGGRMNLLDETIDMTLKATGAGPSLLALKAPIGIKGPLAKPRVALLAGSDAAWLDAPVQSAPAHALAPDLRVLAQRNTCVN